MEVTIASQPSLDCIAAVADAAPSTTTTTTSGRSMIGIAVVSDANFIASLWPLIEVNRMYADRHGYDFFVLNPSNEAACRYYDDFFFNKHCAVRMHLTQMPPNYALVVLDGDVIAVSPSVSLDRWLSYRSEANDGRAEDVVLYERSWNFEIMAGNYIVRNTPFGLYFLDIWMQYYVHSRDIKGFSSSDNGAVHLAVLQALDLPPYDYRECVTRYRSLTSDVTNLTDYFQFVACSRRALGPNRRWIVRDGVVNGSLTVLHRYHGFAIDAAVVGGRKRDGAIPFVHGEKKAVDAVRHYYGVDGIGDGGWNGTYPDQDDHERPPTWPSHSAHGIAIASSDDWLAGVKDSTMPWAAVPRMRLGSCVKDFSCEPTSMDGKPDRFAYRDPSVLLLEYSAFTHHVVGIVGGRVG